MGLLALIELRPGFVFMVRRSLPADAKRWYLADGQASRAFMTDVSPGKPSADEPPRKEVGCTLGANPMQQNEQGATNLLRLSCTLSNNRPPMALLLLFGARNRFFRSKRTIKMQTQ
ncbi:hypothetical protein NJH78_09985 [Pseudomonas chlororaphis]|uniref:hypothetical protein n=1 Tax=Pseudomonas chlororaphis TaxID=587753 RepID=UPI00209B5993|nr:hypothetical protein [Pseudomonas chlororaphis]MCO7570303.1 hypothetical protein [Pseudomonas chlororaphis]MCO7587450.1 hypothetical protein [Pseudomonas chlororaphis]